MTTVSADGTAADARSPRFKLWVYFWVTNLVAMLSAFEAAGGSKEGEKVWTLICTTMVFIVTTLVVLLHLLPIGSVFIVNTPVEGIISAVILALWTSAVAVVSDAANGLAVDEDGAVQDGNLYYFSWASFLIVVMLTASYLRTAFNLDLSYEMKARSPRMIYWAALMATSIVLMWTTADVYNGDCGSSDRPEKFCRRTLFGVSLGCISTLCALAMVCGSIMTLNIPFTVEVGISLMLFVLYCFGVAYITSDDGPGGPLGNVYYFSWLSFGLSFWLSSLCYEEYKANEIEREDAAEAQAGSGEQQVASL